MRDDKYLTSRMSDSATDLIASYIYINVIFIAILGENFIIQQIPNTYNSFSSLNIIF